MTNRLYYTDASVLEFDTTAVAHDGDPTHLILEQTAFYPTSGGQPHDTGTINAVAVLDVIDGEHEIIHVMASAVAPGPVRGIVDASRRHDHMQQHTAQHLLSAIAADTFGWETASVHFGGDHSTIEFATAAASDAAQRRLEVAANAAIASARQVTVSFESAADATARGLRKASDREGILRVVSIEGIDRSACGGTHVLRTSEIGMVRITGTERLRGHTRIGFLAGDRVLANARAQMELLTALATDLGCAVGEVPSIAASRMADLTDTRKQLQSVEVELAGMRVRALAAAAAADGGEIAHLRYQASTDSVSMLRAMAQQVAALSRATLTIVDPGARTIHHATSADSGLDAGARLKAALLAAGGRGGGNARAAQGSVPTSANLSDVVDTLCR